MQVSVAAVLQAVKVIEDLLNVPLPPKAAYRLARLAEALSREAVVIEQRRVEIIKKYGVEAEGGWSVPAEQMPSFVDDWKPILDEVIDVAVEPLPLSVLGVPLYRV